jgi:hypothetical protein
VARIDASVFDARSLARAVAVKFAFLGRLLWFRIAVGEGIALAHVLRTLASCDVVRGRANGVYRARVLVAANVDAALVLALVVLWTLVVRVALDALAPLERTALITRWTSARCSVVVTEALC